MSDLERRASAAAAELGEMCECGTHEPPWFVSECALCTKRIIARVLTESVKAERKSCADIADRQMRAGGITRAELDIATTIRNLILLRGFKEASDAE